LKYREVIRLVEQDGWQQTTQKGSHRQFKHPTKTGKVTIAGHTNQDVPPGVLQSILKQAQIRLGGQR